VRSHCCRSPLPILALSLSLPSCASVLAERPPDWAQNGQAHAYPTERYLVGVGSGTSLDGARDLARAELARQFSVKIEAILETEQTSDSVRSSGGLLLLDHESVRDLVRTKSEETLQGVQIAQVYVDGGRGLTFALAVLERRPAEERLIGRIDELDKEAASQLAIAKATRDDRLARLRALTAARRLLRERTVLNDQLVVLERTGQGPRGSVGPAGLGEAIRETLASIRVRVVASLPGEVESAVQEAVAAVGLSVTREEVDAELVLRAELSMQVSDRLRESGFVYSEGVLLVSLEPRTENQPPLAGRYSAKDGGRTEPEATARVLRRLHGRLVVELRKTLDSYLASKS